MDESRSRRGTVLLGQLAANSQKRYHRRRFVPQPARPRAQEARPLIVVSNDYGELGLAMFFLRGQELSGKVALALPDRLYPGHEHLIPGATHHYSSVADLLELVDQHGANPVLLFSGYLFSNNDLFTRDELKQLVEQLQHRGCVVGTSDPFLGLASTLTRDDVKLDVPIKPWLRLVLGWLERRFVRDLSKVAEILSSTVHLYHAAPDEFLQRHEFPAAAFANPRLATPPIESSEKRWLFVLGAEDAQWGTFAEGAMTSRGDPWLVERRATAKPSDGAPQPFIARVSSLLEQSVAAGRRPTLIAPAKLIDTLPPESAELAELVPFCTFPEFLDRLTSAECVFYWNVISASILPRLVLALPVFFFDRGHMSRLVRPMYDLAVDQHYGGREPTYLDPAEPLDPVELGNVWAEHGLGNPAVLERRRAESLTPEELVQRLVEEPDATSWLKSVRAAPSASEDLETDLEKGARLVEAQRWQQALPVLEVAVDEQPGDSRPHELLGRAAAKVGDFELSARHYGRVVELGRADASVMIGLGNALASLGRPEDARNAYQAVIELEPDNHEAHIEVGVALEQLGPAEAAVKHYRRAIELNPEQPAAYVELGRTLCALGRADEAATPTERAIELGEATPLLYMRLGRAHATLGNVGLAAAAYQRAAAIVPFWAEIQRRVGELSAARGRFKEAAAFFLLAVQDRPMTDASTSDYYGERTEERIGLVIRVASWIPAYLELARLLEHDARPKEAALVRSRVETLRSAAPASLRPAAAGAAPDPLGSYREASARLVGRSFAFLGLGIREPETLRIWRDRFPHATIVGIDESSVDLDDPTGRVRVYQGDPEKRPWLDGITRDVAPDGYEIIVDDTLQRGRGAQATFQHLFHRALKPGGVYVVEDWQSGYVPDCPQLGAPRVNLPGRELGMHDFVKNLVDNAEAYARVVFAENRVFVFKKTEQAAQSTEVPLRRARRPAPTYDESSTKNDATK